MKAAVIFEKNTDPSLPASHTIKVRFTVAPGSYSGDIKQINVPQMRGESNSDGEALAGVTVPVIQNSFLVGLSPGNAETANLRLVSDLPWIDVPMLLTSGKIAKLTFEKGLGRPARHRGGDGVLAETLVDRTGRSLRRQIVGSPAVTGRLGGVAGLAFQREECAARAARSRHGASAAMRFTASNSSRETTSIAASSRSTWPRTTVSISRRTP